MNVKFEGISAGIPNIPHMPYRQALPMQKMTKSARSADFEIDDRLGQPMCTRSNVKATNV